MCYDRSKLFKAEDWPQPKQNLAWIDIKQDDMGAGRKPRPRGRSGWIEKGMGDHELASPSPIAFQRRIS